MRWPVFFILAYLILGAQVGVGESPNLVLLAVVFVSLNAARDTALVAAVMLGLVQDFLSLHPLGLYAFAYGLVGLVCTTSGRVVYVDHPLTHVVYGFVCQIVTAAVILSHSYLRPGGGAAGHEPAAPLFWSAVYTALVAPVLLYLLGRLRPLLGFKTPKRRPSLYE